MTDKAHLERLRDAWQARAPFDDLAVAPLVGALPVTLLHAVATWVARGVPARGDVRAMHHLFDALETLTVACWLAVPPWILARAMGTSPHGRSRRAALGCLALGVLASLGMHAILGDHFRRQGDAALDGMLAMPLRIAMTVGSGFGVVVAGLLGILARRAAPRGASLIAVAGLSALVTNEVVLRDDYASVHAGIAWAAAMALGGALGESLRTRLERSRPLVGVLATAAAIGTLVPPSNAVRLELVRATTASASWVLAQVAWRAPRVGSANEVASAPAATLLGRDRLAAPHEPLAPAPIVVLITVDALRADVVADEANARRFPNLTRLRKRGLYIPRAVSTGSQTAVSLSALFSGRSYSGQRWSLYGKGQARFLYPAADDAPRLCERLTEGGVESESFVSLQFLAGDFGVARGFTREQHLTEGRKHALASTVMPPLLAALDRHPEGKPLFLFTHLTEPHEPYDRGALREGSPWERYLSEIEVVDQWIGRVHKRLEAKARGRGYLIVTADHGEAFGEHGTTFHTKTLYDELLRVPLFVAGPGLRARRCDTLASLLDIGPTVLDLFGLPGDLDSLGTTLLPLALAERACEAPRPPVVAEGRQRRAFYRADGLKVIEDLRHKTLEVYDLAQDPGEQTNLFERDPRSADAVALARATFERLTLPGVMPPYKP